MRVLVYAFATMLMAIASSAVAQDLQPSITACLNKGGKVARSDQIEGCSTLISSGHYSGKDLAVIYYNRGVGYSETDREKAIADFSESIRLNPGDEDSWVNRAASRFWQKQYSQAIADYSEAIRLAASDDEAFRDRGNAYLEEKDYAHAVADYGEALKMKPDNGAYHHSLCRAFGRWGRQLQDALANCDTAIAARPDRLDFRNTRGLIHLKLRQWDAAIADFDAAAAGEGAVKAEALFGRAVAKKWSGKAALIAGAKADMASARAVDAGVGQRYATWGIAP